MKPPPRKVLEATKSLTQNIAALCAVLRAEDIHAETADVLAQVWAFEDGLLSEGEQHSWPSTRQWMNGVLKICLKLTEDCHEVQGHRENPGDDAEASAG